MNWKAIAVTAGMLAMVGCATEATSSSGLKMAVAKVQTGSDGLSAEQRNIQSRIIEDNKIGAIKHLYIISGYSGQPIIYSTVKGKVTSGSKRLSPSAARDSNGNGFLVRFGEQAYYTSEVLDDNGSYGSSSEYIFWWDTKDVFHQHFMTGGQIVHVSSEPISIKGVIMSMEHAGK